MRFYTKGLGHWQNELIDPEELSIRTLLLFRPFTGRTHQLRVAAKIIGLPLSGNPIYSNKNLIHDHSRTMLHSTILHIPEHDGMPEIMVYSPPPFSVCWNEKGREIFEKEFLTLFERSCECHKILKLVKNSNFTT